MTSQGHISVLCVTNGLQRNNIWHVTEKDTLERTHIYVLSVRNVFHLIPACVTIWIFIEINASAQNVANVVIVVTTWQHTDEVIQERNRLNVVFVENDLHWLEALLCTAEFTVERNHTNVTCATRHLLGLIFWTLIWESTQETNHTSVHYVINVSASTVTCSDINIVYTATEDHITVLTVGSCLRQTLNWSFMIVFTLMQSHTHVDTVQTVLDGLTNSRHICLSHTMKVLGSHVTFVSSSSLHVLNWSYIHFDVMKMWSRMFAVNVQSVSVQQLNWDFIIWFTQMLKVSLVVCVMIVSTFNQPQNFVKHFKKCADNTRFNNVV